MGRPPVPTATVALIASGVIERGVKFGRYDVSDFSEYKIPGSTLSYRERTFRDAAQEAWEIVNAVEAKRPPD